MKSIQSSISRIFRDGSTTCYELDYLSGTLMKPGQYILARGGDDILPIALFPCGMQGQQFTCTPPKNGNWHVGDLLSIRYPLGKGFSLPGPIDCLLMISGSTNSLRLLPTARDVLERGGEAALFAYNPPAQISPEIELLTRDQLPEAVAWADCIIGDSAIGNLSVWKSMAAGRDRSDKKRNIQVLVDTPMVCTGSAYCGVCAVKTRRGWKHACTDGPVFLLEELDI
jgi:hypothetical protein